MFTELKLRSHTEDVTLKVKPPVAGLSVSGPAPLPITRLSIV
jgi:hypothetical protein